MKNRNSKKYVVVGIAALIVMAVSIYVASSMSEGDMRPFAVTVGVIGAMASGLTLAVVLVELVRIVIEKECEKQAAIDEAERKEREEHEQKLWQMQKNFAVIDQMDGHEFEWFVAKILTKIGFQNVQVTKASGDYGVDIIAYDNGVKCAFQCKRYTGTLGLQPIQEVSAGAEYYGASAAYVVTNSHFSANAANLADRLGVKLWDRNSLNYLINRINETERKIAVETND